MKKNSVLGPKTAVFTPFVGHGMMTTVVGRGDLAGIPLETLFQNLSGDSYLTLWKKTVKYLLTEQGHNINYEKWAVCKHAALDCLELREDIARKFGDIQGEPRNLGLHELCEGILGKIQILKRFEAVYNRQLAPFGDHKLIPEPTFITGKVPEWNPRVMEAYPQISNSLKVSSV